jgi:hypothetical protein
MESSNVTVELRKKIVELAGQDIGRQVIDLLLKYGIKIVTEISSASVNLPGIEIKTIDQAPCNIARRCMFECKINGKSLGTMLQRVELDPFDYADGDLLRVRLTILPVLQVEGEDDGGKK